MKKYDIILFDLDGTLTDPGEGITNSVAYALKKYGIEVENKKDLLKFIGPPLYDSFRMYYGFSEEKSREAIAFYREYYSVKGIYECKLYDGIPELLKSLRDAGKTVILATSKPDFFAEMVLEHYGILKYFDFVGGASADEKTRGTKEAVIAYIFEELNIQKRENVVMVGDRHYDVNGAKEFSIDSIGVLFGFGDREELETAGATYIAADIDEIKKILL